ncbi:hypothetical protein AGMMS50293_11590 [Spirochaetia bacterium]|nr:hypothetical protein AGMMS50293_11590 [Spirochaetia bacterium]
MVVPSANVLENCYAAGEVKIIKTAATTGITSAGGLVGLWRKGTIKNCAVLGASVVATGGSSPAAGRIYGSSGGGSGFGSAMNNYGNADMYVGATNPVTVTGSTDNNNKHGADTPYTNFANAYWWRSSPQFNETNWDFINTPYRFRPAVKDTKGVVMIGQ